MRKCRICGKETDKVVSSYNHHAWMCNEHEEIFTLFAIHWRYKEHAPVAYGVEVELPNFVPQPLHVIMGTKPMETGEPDKIIPYRGNPNEGKNPYAHIVYNPEARGFARPRGKHLKIYPRWTGMQPKDYEENGPVINTNTGVPAGIIPLSAINNKKIADTDYASKSIVWDSSNIYTKS